MKKKKQKNSKQFNRQFKKKFFTKKSAIIIVCTVVILSVFWMGYQRVEKKTAKYQKTIDELKTDVKNIKQTNKELEKEKNNLNTDESKERIARERLGMIKEGEVSLQQEKDEEDGENTTAVEDTDSSESTQTTHAEDQNTATTTASSENTATTKAASSDTTKTTQTSN